MTNGERLATAMRQAVEGRLIPKYATADDYARRWRVMGEILDAACGDTVELAQAVRHIAEELASGGDIATAVDALHDLATDIHPGSEAGLEAYVIEEDADG